MSSVAGRSVVADSLSDEALLAGVAVRDPGSTTAFIRRFQRRVYGVALAVTGDRAEAEDVAQEAFERAWRHAGVYDPRRGSVQSWLSTITRNLAIDHLRSRRWVLADGDWEQLLPASVARGPDEEAVLSWEARSLLQAMCALPAPQSRALALATYRGLTTAEIAEVENVPQGTVKTRIHAAMRKLREALDSREVGS